VLHLSRHDGSGYALSLEGLNELGEFAQGKPVDGSGSVLFYFRRRFFPDGGDYDLVSLGSGSVEDKEWKAAVASDEAKALGR